MAEQLNIDNAIINLTDSDRDEIDNMFDDTFSIPELTTYWPTIEAVYDLFKFNACLTDEEKITEYKWIIEQLKKFTGSKRQGFYDLRYKLYDLRDAIVYQRKSVDELLEDRKHVIYTYIRNSWLDNFLMNVDAMIRTLGGYY